MDTSWITADWPASRLASIGADQGRAFHAVEEVAEEALLGALEGGERTAALAWELSVDVVVGDVGGLQCGLEVVVDDDEGASA